MGRNCHILNNNALHALEYSICTTVTFKACHNITICILHIFSLILVLQYTLKSKKYKTILQEFLFINV
jgi:hypothetical protein